MKHNYEDREALQACLNQMASLPRLTPDEERAAVHRLTMANRRLRVCLLSCGFILDKVAGMFDRIERRELRLDYTLGFSTNDSAERRRVAKCLPVVLAEIRGTLRDNCRSFARAMTKSTPRDERIRSWRGMPGRRRRAVVDIHQVGVRTRHLQRWQRQLEKLAMEMQWLGRKVRCLGGVGDGDMEKGTTRAAVCAP
jgi:hypothetical protein